MDHISDPAPVSASSVFFHLLNDSIGSLTWAKPADEIDDCITGYLVTFHEKVSQILDDAI